MNAKAWMEVGVGVCHSLDGSRSWGMPQLGGKSEFVCAKACRSELGYLTTMVFEKAIWEVQFFLCDFIGFDF